MSVTAQSSCGNFTIFSSNCPTSALNSCNENKLVTAWWPSSVNKVFPSSQETSAKEEAKKMRKMLPNFMKPEALQRYIGIMDTVAQRHFADGWENRKEVEVFPLAKNYTFLACCTAVC
ncbi:hypothetical protein PRUPE_6G127800 [Prunus persica]|uniref:Uncharacterized protein n=1 Tax=Prunus persica TaxID=3760 RepID=M5W4H6_PRUPE|nr:hypothetical protein PRUPE_6G127800 [Prunus persica]